MTITKREIRNRIEILLLAIGGFFIVQDIRPSIANMLPNISPFFIGLIIILLVLYFNKKNK